MADHRDEIRDFNPVLFHGVAVANSDGVEQLRPFFAERIEVYRDAPGRALLVLIAIPFANVAAVVPFGGEIRLEQVEDLPGFFNERRLVAQQGEHRHFDRRDAWGKFHNDAGVARGNLFFRIGCADEGETNAVHSGARFNHVGDKFFLRLIVEVFHALAGELLVLAEVKIAAGGNAFEFLDPKWKGEHDIHAGAGVVGKFFFLILVHAELVSRQADGFIPLQSFCDPGLVPVGIGPGLDEELQFHLLEFPAAERKVAGVNFIAERLADLRNAKRNFLAGDAEDVLKLNKNHLRGFRSEVDLVGFIFDRTSVRLEHEIELPGFRVIVRAPFRAFGVGQLIGAPAALALLAVDHRIAEGGDVTGGFPHPGVGDDRAVDSHDIGAAADRVRPPGVADIAFKFGAGGAIVPKPVDPAINFRGLKDKAAPFAKGDDFFHETSYFGVRHSGADYGMDIPGKSRQRRFSACVSGAGPLPIPGNNRREIDMNRYLKLFLGTLVMALLLVPVSLWAANNAPASAKEKKPKVFAKIVSVDSAKNTVTITDIDGTEKTFTINTFTKITIEGKPGKLADVATGMKADFMTSGTRLSRLEVTTPPEEKPEKKK